jgi:predicted HTH transcriptional regulator
MLSGRFAGHITLYRQEFCAMTEKELRSLLGRGESETLELKSSVPPPDQIAHILASMANTQGGLLAIGVKEPDRAVGANVHRAKAMLEAAQRYMAPPLAASIEVLNLDGHPVVLATVPKTAHLVSASGGYYRRIGDRSRPLTAEEIRDHAVAEKNDVRALSQLSVAVAAATQTIDQLRKDFDSANSPWKKIGIALVGALAGAIAKHLFDVYF